MSNPNQTPCPFCGKVHHGSDELAGLLYEMPSSLRDLFDPSSVRPRVAWWGGDASPESVEPNRRSATSSRLL